MPRYNLPDHLICLGGGGIEVGKTFMSQDWILEEIIRENPREERDSTVETPQPLHAYFIDSDGASLPDRIEKEVEERVEDIETEYNPGDHPLVDVNTIQIAEGAHEKFLTSETVVSESQMSDLLTDEGLKAWWLSDSGDLMNPLDGLKRGGVDRKRGLTKAIYRISQWKDDKLSAIEQTLRTVSDPNVAMVVGLGGGTGSGLCLDVARRIKEVGATVTLFGILPKPSGGDDDDSVLANAYATLSELEYLALSDENYFENIMLLPFDPAEDANVFDKAAVYTITSYYNLGHGIMRIFDETESDGPPKYAPFTVASTRYLHYAKEEIDMTKHNFRTYLENKQTAIRVEEHLYDEIEAFIERTNPDAADELSSTDGKSDMRLPDSDALALQARIDRVKEFLDADFMENLEFRCTKELKSDLEDIESTAEDKATWNLQPDKEVAVAREFAERVSKINTASDYRPESGWATDEQRFVELLTREFKLITRRAGIIRASSAIESEASDPDSPEAAIATDINNAIDKSHSGFGTEIEDTIRLCEKEIEELEAELDRLDVAMNSIDDVARDLRTEWRSSVDQLAEQYHAIITNSEQIERSLNELREELTDAVLEIAATRNPDQIDITSTSFDRYSELNRLLDEVGCSRVDKEAIERSVMGLREARRRRSRAETYGLIQRILPGSPSVEELQADYRHLCLQEIDDSIIDVTGWDEEFDVSVDNSYFSDRLSEMEHRREELRARIAEETERVIRRARDLRRQPVQLSHEDSEHILSGLTTTESTTSDQSNVREQLEQLLVESELSRRVSSGQELCSVLLDEVVDERISEALRKPFTEAINSRRRKLENLKRRLEQYQHLSSIVEEDGGNYSSALDSVGGISEITADSSTSSTEFREVVDSVRLAGSDDLGDTDIWKKERDKTRNKIKRKVIPDIGGQHLPVHESKIENSDTVQVHYDGYRVASTFMCRFFEEYSNDESAEISLVTDRLNGIDYINEDGYRPARGTFADNFDFSVTTFLNGVFLDNLKIFTEDCHDAYMDRTDILPGEARHNHQQQIPGAVEHHTYGLDGVTYHHEEQFLPPESDGGFCYRRDVLDLTGNGTEVLLDQAPERKANSRQVAQELREEYYEIVGYPSSVNPE